MFRLYKEEQSTLPFADYKLIIESAAGKQSALEFGPGYSTLALIEAGVPRIVTLEYNDEWFEKAKEKFGEYAQVQIGRYSDEPEATGDLQEGEEFDVAFVDSPKGYKFVEGKTPPGGRKIHPGQEDCSRLNTCLLALKHAPIVYLHDAYRPCERATLGRLNAMGHKVSFLSQSGAGIARIERHG